MKPTRFQVDEARSVMTTLRERESSFRLELDKIVAELGSAPRVQHVKQKAALIRKLLQEYFDSPMRLAKMTFDEKRKLISTFFGGKDIHGRRLGVYVTRTEDGISYEIRGIFDRVFESSLEHHEALAEAAKAEANMPIKGP